MSSYVKEMSWQEANLWPEKKPLLTHFDIELTERCNFNCIHCYINQPAGNTDLKERELSTVQIMETLDELAEMGVFTVRFSGGEPLLRDDFEELYLHARRLGLQVVLFTNASLITSQLAELFSRMPPLAKIEITVYGMSTQSCEAVTGLRGAFKAVRRGIDLLLEYNVPFIVKGALLPPNEHELEDFLTWAASLPWGEPTPRLSYFFHLRGRRDSTSKNQQIIGFRSTPETGLAVKSKSKNAYIEGMQQFCSHFIGPQGDELFNCGAGKSICLDAYGRLQPCMLLRHPETTIDLTANGNDQPFRDAVTKRFPKILTRKAENQEYLSRCAKCFLKGLCDQCPARSWMEHGTLDTPVEYLCQVAHAEARGLGLLFDGEHAWEVKDWQSRIIKMNS